MSGFAGTKSIVLTTAGPFGGKNNFLPITYIILGVFCIIIAGIFYFKKGSLAANQKHI